jgi:hypothetical protein
MIIGLLAASSISVAAHAADSATKPAGPCADAAYHALDFWSGSWTAIIPAGGPLPSGAAAETDVAAAAAKVERIVDGCAYLEHWDSEPFGDGQVSRGKGFHRYDAATGKWRQLWINNSGKENLSIGEPFEGGVRYTSERTGPNGETVINRQTIAPLADGTVRNSSDSSADGGKTWAPSYEFIYQRK